MLGCAKSLINNKSSKTRKAQNIKVAIQKTLIPDELRYQLLKKLHANPDISQRELSRQVGLSLGKTNYCLKALIEAGWVKAGNFARSSNKLNYAYVLTPKGVSEKAAVTLRFLQNKQEQYRQLENEITLLKKEAAVQK